MTEALTTDQQKVKTWKWKEIRDAETWLPKQIEKHIGEQFKDILSFTEVKFDGEGSCFVRKHKPVITFFYDLVLKNCHFNIVKDENDDISFDLKIDNFSDGGIDDTEIKFLEYPKPVEESLIDQLIQLLKKAQEKIIDEFVNDYYKSFEEEVKIKNGQIPIPEKPQEQKAQTDTQQKKNIRNYKYEKSFNASAEMIFKLFTDTNMIQHLTQSSGDFELKKNGKWNYLNKNLSGTVQDFKTDEYISLRLESDGFVDSIVDIKILKSENNLTKLTLEHSHIPEISFLKAEQMWDQGFIKRLNKMFEANI